LGVQEEGAATATLTAGANSPRFLGAATKGERKENKRKQNTEPRRSKLRPGREEDKKGKTHKKKKKKKKKTREHRPPRDLRNRGTNRQDTLAEREEKGKKQKGEIGKRC